MALVTQQELIGLSQGGEPNPWLVDGLIRRESLGLIAGSPKAGKTYCALHLAQAVASGRAFLGQIATQAVPVLFVELEDSPALLAQRSIALLKGHGIPADETRNLSFLFDPVRIDLAQGLETLSHAIASCGAKLVILDTLARAHGLSENNQAHATALIRGLDMLRQRHRCAILGSHHVSKAAKSGRGGHALRGSSVIHAGLENSLMLWREGEGNTVKVEVESKFAASSSLSYRVEKDGEALRLALVPDSPARPVRGQPGAGVALIRRWRQRERRRR